MSVHTHAMRIYDMFANDLAIAKQKPTSRLTVPSGAAAACTCACTFRVRVHIMLQLCLA